MQDSRGKVIIVGAGVAGLTAGYLLSRKGFEIVVFEKVHCMDVNIEFIASDGTSFLIQIRSYKSIINY